MPGDKTRDRLTTSNELSGFLCPDKSEEEEEDLLDEDEPDEFPQ